VRDQVTDHYKITHKTILLFARLYIVNILYSRQAAYETRPVECSSVLFHKEQALKDSALAVVEF
jgi:hypothetical protein